MIGYDPTEAREQSPINDAMKEHAISVKGLEAATGADLFVSKNDIDPNCLAHHRSKEIGRALISGMDTQEIVSSLGVPVPVVIRLKKFVDALNAREVVLIQRKSGGDLIGSIPDLSRKLLLMLDWTDRAWLLITGEFKSSPSGKVTINGRVTEYDYNAMLGAIDAWQERGGYVAWLERDSLVLNWLRLAEKREQKRAGDKVVLFRNSVQQLIGSDDKDAWIATLMSFPGIGPELATRIAHYGGSLASSLCFISAEDSYRWDGRPDGFGPLLSRKARERLGLLEGQYLEVVTKFEDKK